jgi:hypothetical protein
MSVTGEQKRGWELIDATGFGKQKGQCKMLVMVMTA